MFKHLIDRLLGSNPYTGRNERESCVCGTKRRDVPKHLWRVTDKEADLIFPQFYYRCPNCSSFSAVNLYFPTEKYEAMPLDAMHISEVKVQLNRARLTWMNETISFPGDAVVFDLGAGEGCFVNVFTEFYPGATVYAVEADSRLEKRFYSNNPRVVFVPMYIEAFLDRSLKDAGMQRPFLIVLTDVLEHLLAPEQLLRTIAQVLVPGGYAYLTVPDAKTFQAPFPFAVPSQSVDWPQANRTCQHLWMMQPEVFRNLVSKDFSIVADAGPLETNIRKDSNYSTLLAQRKL